MEIFIKPDYDSNSKDKCSPCCSCLWPLPPDPGEEVRRGGPCSLCVQRCLRTAVRWKPGQSRQGGQEF